MKRKRSAHRYLRSKAARLRCYLNEGTIEIAFPDHKTDLK